MYKRRHVIRRPLGLLQEGGGGGGVSGWLKELRWWWMWRGVGGGGRAPTNLTGVDIMSSRAARRSAEQLWGRLQVKDESSPEGAHQSLMEWHIREERRREGVGERGCGGVGTQQTANAPACCWALTLLRTSRCCRIESVQKGPVIRRKKKGGEGGFRGLVMQHQWRHHDRRRPGTGVTSRVLFQHRSGKQCASRQQWWLQSTNSNTTRLQAAWCRGRELFAAGCVLQIGS